MHHRALATGLLAVLSLASVAACVSADPPSPSSGSVQVVRELAAVAKCQRLSTIRAGSLIGGAMTSVGYSNTVAELQSKAAAAGGTHVLIIDMSSGFAGSNAMGDAYRCGR
jgi:hypothetical protein